MEAGFWPVHPQPLPDELLSSWMIRLAQGNGFKIHSFYAQFFGSDREIWTRDIDHHAPAWLVDGLAVRTGVPRERIERATLRSFEPFVFERFNPAGATRWVMPLSVFHRTRRAYGQQFCPLCLQEDPAPYLRRQWRLALVPVCVRHEVLLQDRCGSCGSPLMPHRADTSPSRSWRKGPTVLRCSACRGALPTTTIQVSAADVELQTHLCEVIECGYAFVGTTPVYSHLYFDGLRVLMTGLGRLDGAHARRSMLFEWTAAADRLAKLRAAVALLDEWPSTFLNKCATVRKPYTTFAKDALKIPWWLDAVLRRELFSTRARLAGDEAEAIVKAARVVTGRATAAAARRFSGRDVSRVLCQPGVSNEMADRFIASLERRMGAAPARQQLILSRDMVMFLVGRSMHLSLTRLAQLEAPAQPAVSVGGSTDGRSKGCGRTGNEFVDWYMQQIRPQLAKERTTRELFITPQGKALGVKGISRRFTMALAAAGMTSSVQGWRQWIRPF